MPKPPNKTLRALVPLIVLAAGVGIAYTFWRGSPSKPAQPPATAPASPTPAPATLPPALEQPPQPSPAAQPPTATGAAPTGDLRALPGTPGEWATLGSLAKADGYLAQVTFSKTGAGIDQLALTDHFLTIKEEAHVVVQREHTTSWSGVTAALAPMASLALEVTLPGVAPQIVNLSAGGPDTRWSPVAGSPGTFEAIIADAAGARVLRVVRAWSLPKDSYTLRVDQRIENLSGTPLTVRYFQIGPVDLDQDAASYGGDKRRVRFGYLLPARLDPSRAAVISDDFVTQRSDALGKRAEGGMYAETTLWPNDKSKPEGFELAWAGMTNRYFGAAVVPAIDPKAAKVERRLDWVAAVSRVVLDGGAGAEVIALRLESAPITLAPGAAAASLPVDLYAGPLDRSIIAKEPTPAASNLRGLVIYNFGGPCGFCTFDILTSLLLGLLHFLHDVVFRDWSLAIIFLVVIVRSCLHPVTRWSQIRMAIFGKQMAGMAPKQKEIQEKFRGDTKKIQEETQKLWREQGISPAGFLGCLPAFLQTPVWIALYATLYFAVELRHQGAFYGLFQVQPTASPFWQFLGDLAESDRFIYFGKVLFTVPLLGPIDAVNILPLLLGIVFFIQQKYLTPPTTAAMTPEQEMQQKMMKWMTVIMFPVFMYNAPSGLSLYFVTNSTLAIMESKWIRSHMDKHGMLDMDKMKARRAAKAAGAGTAMWDRKSAAPAKEEGFFAKLQRLAEEKQRQGQKGAKKRKP
ncbi:Membrane protein insertase YidC [Phycisphaerales bacterium]|nr:Membrane protein insertase YidC [Phycisphaerales bacterium]